MMYKLLFCCCVFFVGNIAHAQLIGLSNYDPDIEDSYLLSMNGYNSFKDDFFIRNIPNLKGNVKELSIVNNAELGSISTTVYSFDEMGRITEVEKESWDGNLELFYTYDFDGNLKTVERTSNAYDIEVTEVFNYQDHWINEQEILSDAYDGDFNCTISYNYNEEKDSVYLDYQYKNDDPSMDREVSHYYLFDFDKQGRLVKEYKFGTEGEYDFGHNEDYSYDEQGRIVGINHFSICATMNSCLMISIAFDYDNPQLVNVNLHDATIRNALWTHDGQQNYYYSNSTYYEYEYDEQGNWIKRTSKDGEVTEREIEYYN